MSLRKTLHALRSFLQVEADNIRRHDVSWRRRVWLYRNGFLSSKDDLWTLTGGSKTRYLSDLQGLDSNLRGINAPYDSALENKLLFSLLVDSSHPEFLPTLYGIVRDGEIVSVDPLTQDVTFDELLELLRAQPIVVKPTTTAQGDGVRLLDREGDRLYIDDRQVSQEDLREELQSDRELLLQEYVHQANYAAAIYPDSVNTVRLMTMVDPDTGRPFLAAGMHRFGTAGTGAIDNVSSGGISAGIDLESGELGPVLTPATGTDTGWSFQESHPDTGTTIAGTTIPRWEAVTEQVLELATAFAGLWPLVAWDVVVTDDADTITVLEGNTNPDTKYIQAHQPLLATERTRRFFEAHGLL